MNNEKRLQRFSDDVVSITIDGEEQLDVVRTLRRKPWWRRQVASMLRWCERHKHADDYDVTWFSFPRFSRYKINIGFGPDYDNIAYLRDCARHAWRSTVCAVKDHAWETDGDHDWCARCHRTRGGSC